MLVGESGIRYQTMYSVTVIAVFLLFFGMN